MLLLRIKIVSVYVGLLSFTKRLNFFKSLKKHDYVKQNFKSIWSLLIAKTDDRIKPWRLLLESIDIRLTRVSTIPRHVSKHYRVPKRNRHPLNHAYNFHSIQIILQIFLQNNHLYLLKDFCKKISFCTKTLQTADQ